MTVRVKQPTPERLWARALFYLERYASTAANLRRMLLRRALREAEALALDPAAVARDVDEVVRRVVAAGLVNDRLFAESRARRLAEQGRSGSRIRAQLAAKGVDREAAGDALARLGGELGDVELAAAVALARKRRLGPWRAAAERAAARPKDLAVLARAGFAYDLARRVIDAEAPAELEDRLRAARGDQG